MSQFIRNLSKKNSVSLVAIVVLIAAFVLYLILRKDYGLSSDEVIYYQYGDININAIKKFIFGLKFDSLFDFYDLKYYGSAYLVFGTALVRLLRMIFSSLDVYAAWHTLNFLVFLSGAGILFKLSKRFTSEKAALFAVLLYLTQPLLWGHGVMNPKDIPFMVTFLAAVELGMSAVDRINEASETQPLRTTKKLIKKQPALIVLTALLSLLAVFSFVDRVLANALTRPLIDQMFTFIQKSTGAFLSPFKAKLAAGLASGIYIETYALKLLEQVNLVEFILIAAAVILALVLLIKRFSPVFRRVLLAGAFLGITSSVRVLGPAAGGLVVLYALFTPGKKQLKFLAIYVVSALLVMYLTWPYLWVDPVNRFIECIKVMQNFPWGGSILFNSNEYLASTLPWYYLPELLTLQFTLPLLILADVGTVLCVIALINPKDKRGKIITLLSWFFVPMLLVIIFKPTMYDNFRQFLFIIPPLFVLAGLGFDLITQKLKPIWLRTAVTIALLLPGIVAGAWLHPYEYVYYNALVGWTGNIGQRFENDYWGTSVREAAEYLDQNTTGTHQVAFTNSNLSWTFDYSAERTYDVQVERLEVSMIDPDYSIISTRYNDDQDYYRSMKIIKTIGRGKTVFLVIKAREDSQ